MKVGKLLKLKINKEIMLKTTDLIKKMGNPMQAQEKFESFWMVLWEVPQDILDGIPCLPKKIYINNLIQIPLEKTLRQLIKEGFASEIKTFDGCFNVRYARGLKSLSRHSFGLALDFNAAQNPLFGKVTWSKEFLKVWRDNNWVLGADWITRTDGMHFEWGNLQL
jgi:D-alanyl-D-alanine carboxypeptidase